MRRVIDAKVVITSTGECMDFQIIPEKQRSSGGKWMKLYLDMQKRIALDKSLHGETLHVKDYLIAIADFANNVPGPGQVAKEMSLKAANVSRAYTELKRSGILIKLGGKYRLSPYLCWRGSEAQYKEAVKELTVGYAPKQLTEGNNAR